MHSNVPRSQVVQMSAVNVDQHLRGRDFTQVAERAVGSALEMILHHVRPHFLVVEALQAANLTRVIHLWRFIGRHFQGVRGSGLPDPLPHKIQSNIIKGSARIYDAGTVDRKFNTDLRALRVTGINSTFPR